MARNRVSINGITFEVEGENVSVCNGILYVEGAAVASGLSGTVRIVWQGDLAQLHADGSVECQNVSGNVHAGNSVRCGNISGDVRAGNSVKTFGYGASGASASASASASGYRGDVYATAYNASVSDCGGHGWSISAGNSVHVRGGAGRTGGSIHAGNSVHLD